MKINLLASFGAKFGRELALFLSHVHETLSEIREFSEKKILGAGVEGRRVSLIYCHVFRNVKNGHCFSIYTLEHFLIVLI